MFEIGSSLREARIRQGLDLAEIESETKIRMKYLRAIEEERFDILPAETYVKGFLRSYADRLGLDGQLYVDEFNSRYAADEEPILSPRPGRRPRPSLVESHAVLIALAGIIAVTVLVIAAWRLGGSSPSKQTTLGALPPAAPPASLQPVLPVPSSDPEPGGEGSAAPEADGAAGRQASRAKPVKLVLAAARGDCWVEVHVGSATGELLYQGTIQKGQYERFEARRLFLELGAPGNLVVTLNGKPVKNFPTGTSTALVTAKGVRVVSTV